MIKHNIYCIRFALINGKIRHQPLGMKIVFALHIAQPQYCRLIGKTLSIKRFSFINKSKLCILTHSYILMLDFVEIISFKIIQRFP